MKSTSAALPKHMSSENPALPPQPPAHPEAPDAAAIAGERSAEALRESEERYRTLFESAPMAVFVCDREAVIQTFNRQAAELWGREPVVGVEKYCGSLRLILPDGAVLPHEQNPMREVLRTGVSALGVEVSIERPDGSLLPVLANFAAMKDGHGESTGVVTTFVDVSHHARALQGLTDNERRKDEFLATLAHELHNPLAPIRYAVQILRQSPQSVAVVRQTSEVIKRQVDQMVSLVDDLLDVTRLSQGKVNLRLQRIDLVQAVHHAVEAVHAPSRCSQHPLVLRLPPEPLYVQADPTRLAQILGNLLGNACKFTPAGGQITVAVEQDAGEAVIRFGDTGLGIEPGQLEDIFIMFMQVDCSLERPGSGLGIGLSLARTLVELHGGTVLAHSAGLGKGSQFTVRLPRAN